MKNKDYTVTIIVIVGLFILTMMLNVAVTPDRAPMQPVMKAVHKIVATEPAVYNGREHVEVIDQNVMGKVTLLSAALKESGYVVIHKEEKGKPGKIIGISPILGTGLYSNKALPLTEDVMPGDILYAMLHSDNGDDTFNPAEDSPVTDDEGIVIMRSFMAI